MLRRKGTERGGDEGGREFELTKLTVAVCLDGVESAVVAGVLKKFFRDLPNPLIPFEHYDAFCEIHTEQLGTLSHSL
jgi:hypothetical protein